MLRWLATAAIGLLFALDVFIPHTSIGRRGTDAAVRADLPGAYGAIGQTLPAIELVDLAGAPVSLETMRGHRVLLTFERSVDW